MGSDPFMITYSFSTYSGLLIFSSVASMLSYFSMANYSHDSETQGVEVANYMKQKLTDSFAQMKKGVKLK